MIPLFHDLTGTRVLIAGGGRVGARRARHFGVEADVVVLSEAFADADFGDADLVRTRLEPDDVGTALDRYEPRVVVAATDDAEINAALVAAARERDQLVNRVDGGGSGGPGTVSVPATVRDGPVTVAVGTDGTSPALSGFLVDRFASDVECAGAMADLCADVRADLTAAELPATARRDALRALVRSEDVWTALDRGTCNARQLADDVVRDVTGEPT